MVKKIASTAALITIPLILIFLLLEYSIRVLGYSTYTFEKNDSDFIRYDSLLDYTYAKNLDIRIENENYKVDVKTNSLGYRDDEWVIDHAVNNILILGDSFTAGFGVQKEKRWSDILEVELNNSDSQQKYKIYTAAVSGYNLEQMSTTAEFFLDEMKPKKVILGFYIAGLERLNDPYLYYKGFSVRKSQVESVEKLEGKLYYFLFKNNYLRNIETTLLDNLALYNFLQKKVRVIYSRKKNELLHTNEDLMKGAALLSRLNEKMKEADIELIVLPIIQHNQQRVFDTQEVKSYQWLKSYLEKNDIQFINILPVFKNEIEKGANLWINNDAHWNDNAHQMASEMVLNHVFEFEVTTLYLY